MERVYIGLGSNLADPKQQLEFALDALATIPQAKLIASSSLYCSKPMGPQDQPDYFNAVVAIDTSLEPLMLLDALQQIELDSGRVRKKERWGPRTLDLDILLFGDRVIDNERLTVPHYGMKVREFVIYPLAELCPELTLPDGQSVITIKQKIPQNDLIIHSAISLNENT